jgi:hypothetical protein
MQNFRKSVVIEVNSLVLYVGFLGYKDVFEPETSNKITANDNYNVIIIQHRRDYLSRFWDEQTATYLEN